MSCFGPRFLEGLNILDERAAVRARGDDVRGCVYVSRLTLTNFRCFAHQRLEVALEPVVLTGANGSGKTSVLEALSYLSPGRGLRRVRLDELSRWCDGEAVAWAVSAHVETPNGTVEIGTGRAVGGGGRDRRVVRIDGVNQRSQTSLAEVLAVVWLTPDMDRLFIEGASGRRRLLDRFVFGVDPGHAERLHTYERTMRERAQLLRDAHTDASWLAALEELMAANGVAIAAARREIVLRLSTTCGEPAGPFPGLELDIEGQVEGWLSSEPALACEEKLRGVLENSRRADSEAGFTTVGPHRSDLVVRHKRSGRLAQMCSTGEQKALLIALVLGGARLQMADRGALPVILLDEITAHLDSRHRHALLELVSGMGAQSWLTGSDPTFFRALAGRAQFFSVENEMITAEDQRP